MDLSWLYAIPPPRTWVQGQDRLFDMPAPPPSIIGVPPRSPPHDCTWLDSPVVVSPIANYTSIHSGAEVDLSPDEREFFSTLELTTKAMLPPSDLPCILVAVSPFHVVCHMLCQASACLNVAVFGNTCADHRWHCHFPLCSALARVDGHCQSHALVLHRPKEILPFPACDLHAEEAARGTVYMERRLGDTLPRP
ncbi:Aste57867_16411 [Aphanomyces stellatus]|uniref:Aste57867_16411 protein n=1 Tax=Aphanomyces stellatus TaxID=120398 RepID=A0A485L5R0_9STRA|nr:hypothetical protein As57867_016354 [Aphanomyces stellatus]VFT93186.1 Aste57867_16411 [Aphanomyces stellatus]